MSNSIKIVQITPGVIPIPPNGWGAVEKIIWEYKLVLDRLGYQTDILYCDDVDDKNGQIVHVHMANLANLLHSRGIDYVFSLHDHHVEHFGKGSDCYNQNYEAIKNSKLTFVHSKHLIEYFDNLPNIVYLPHGANSKDYKFIERNLTDSPKLLMMANNGVGGDNLSDRKGFLIGIEAARKLNLELTIICPSSNKVFFDHHNVNYEKLNIIYDLDYKDSVSELYKYDIFLHPSNLEAGHPNLTITESLSTGMPVVGTINIDVPGMVRVERSVEDFTKGIETAIKSYHSLVSQINENRYIFSWEIIVSKMIENYKQFYGISEKSQLIHNYNNVKKNHQTKLDKNLISVKFSSNKAFCKTSIFSDGLSIVFSDRRTGNILYDCSVGKDPGAWAYTYAGDTFIDWKVEVRQGASVIYSESLDLMGKRVLLEIRKSDVLDFIKEHELIEKFIQYTGSKLTIKSSEMLEIEKVCQDSDADTDIFYFTLNETQLIDYFSVKQQKSERYLAVLKSHALGDSIAFVPYCQKWAELKNTQLDVCVKRDEIFDKHYYPNLRFIKESEIDLSNYTDVMRFEYIFDKPLLKGYSDQFNLEFNELRAFIKKSPKPRPIKSKYVCLGVHTTTQAKYWNYYNGWEIISKKLRKEGLTPVAVDLYEMFGIEGSWNYLPESSVKKVGMSFDDVINYIQNCEFFIGVSSGLSWLAWSLGKKVILISGTTEEDNEFQSNCYRLINKKVCHGCFNKSNLFNFDAGNWMWCPVGENTQKWFECSKSITPDDVWQKVKEVLISEDEYVI